MLDRGMDARGSLAYPNMCLGMHILLWRKWRVYILMKLEAVRPSSTFWMLLNPWNFKFYIIWRRLLPRWTVACGSGKRKYGNKSASTFPPTILISVWWIIVWIVQPWEIRTPTSIKVLNLKLLFSLLCNSYFLIGKHTDRWEHIAVVLWGEMKKLWPGVPAAVFLNITCHPMCSAWHMLSELFILTPQHLASTVSPRLYP